ncbi:ATP-binding protein [Epibacterium ulvae]|uniref:ATP-binding protein n=1 Tax=Epibacterium ulvae TaxID=1156985 RepID=UPI002492298D|nr:ATP-binding protein [Epibacterium ulvae]
MSPRGMKRYMPRSLYGRAALILLLPVVALQLVVSVSFVKRDLEDVTAQMSRTILREINLLHDVVEQEETQDAAIARLQPYIGPLNITARFLPQSAASPKDILGLGDFSGRVVQKTLQKNLPNLLAVQFPNNKEVRIFTVTHLGSFEILLDQRRLTAAAPHQLILTLVVFSLLMTMISFVYMRNQLRPIKRLARAAQAFGRGRSMPYVLSGATEVRAAGQAFLDMRARIERQIEQRTLILSGVSHDLRTPLTRLKLGLSLLDEEEIAPLLRDVDEMQALLDAFLDFARDSSTSRPEAVDLKAMAEGVVGDWQRQGKDVMLGDIATAETVTLNGAGIRRAVQNLISNGVRYGSRARLSIFISSASIQICVEDDGPGIPEELWDEAVRPFTRLDPARNQNKGSGVGLGLAIVADVARAHGGVFRLGKSEDLGGLKAELVLGRD